MQLRKPAALLLIMMMGSTAAWADTYVFDSLSRVDLHRTGATITGIRQNMTTPFTVEVRDEAPALPHFLSRCIPMLMTMLEKPGRYYLHLIVTPEDTNRIAMTRCGLELRN
jgi:hypothetical protein